MDLFISTLDLLKRQQGESGADKLLDLLADPYRAQVSLCPYPSQRVSNSGKALPIVHLRKFGNINRLHVASRSRILPPQALQLRRILTEVEDCR